MCCVDRPKAFAFDVAAPLTEWPLKTAMSMPAWPINSVNHLLNVHVATGACGLQWLTNSCSCCSCVNLNFSVLSMYCPAQSTTSKSLCGLYSSQIILMGGWPCFVYFVSFVKVNTKLSHLSSIPAVLRLDNSRARFAVVNAANMVSFNVRSFSDMSSFIPIVLMCLCSYPMFHCILVVEAAYWMPLSWTAELVDADPLSHHQPV